MSGKAIIPLTQKAVVDTEFENYVEKLFLLLRDAFVIVTLLFFLLRGDAYLFQAGMLPVSPILLMAVWIFSVGALWMISAIFEGKYPLVFVRCLPAIIPFAAIMAFSWVGMFSVGEHFSENYKAMLLPTLDFGLFLTGTLIGIMRISDRKWTVLLAVAFVSILITSGVDIVNPGTFSKIENRAAGIFVDPNITAFSMVLFLTALLRWDKQILNFTDMFLIAVCGLGVLFTFSRGGVILFAAIVFLYWLHLKNKDRGYFIIKGTVFLICLASLAVFVFPDTISKLEIFQFKSVRFEWFSGDFEGAFSTSDSRFRLINEYLGLIALNPIVGYGSGYITSLAALWTSGPHNIYLARWFENGIFGLAAYLWLLIAVMRLNRKYKNFSGVAIIVLIMLYGFLSHILLDDRPALLLMSAVTARAVSKQTINHSEK